MVSALILYHSLFGNTKDVAFSLAKGIEEVGVETECMAIDVVRIDQIPNYNFLAIGGPTHKIGLSEAMKEFLKKLKSINLEGIKGFSFDTRIHSRLNKKRWFVFENSAARRIERKMKKMKIIIIKPRKSAIVYGREGPLESNVESSFLKIGTEIGKILVS